MAVCRCEPPTVLHVTPLGVHLEDGAASSLLLVDDVVGIGLPCCSTCAAVLDESFFLCAACDATMCRACVARDTSLVECDCDIDVEVTGVRRAARRAAAALR